MVNELRFLPKIGAYLDTNNKRIHRTDANERSASCALPNNTKCDWYL